MASVVQAPERAVMSAEEIIRVVEDSEMAAWRNLWRAVPAPIAADAGLHAVAVGTGVALVMEKAPMWFFNRVMGVGLHEPITESLIDRLIGIYRNKGLDFAISLSPLVRPGDSARWLEDRGFEVVNQWAKMYRGSEPPPRIETDLRIKKVGRERAVEVGELVCVGFGVPAAWQPIFSSAVHCEGNHVYMAFHGEMPAGVGVLTVNNGVGHINTATTLPLFRGRGVQGALMAHRIREGLKLGCTAFATETGLLPDQVNHSYNNMLRCGFRMAYERPNYLLRHKLQ